MGGSESKSPEVSKASPTGTYTTTTTRATSMQTLLAQKDNLLELLNQATTQRYVEFKAIEDKFNIKLQNVLLSKSVNNGANVSAMLNLKQEKLKLKLKKNKEQYETETKFVSTIRQIYSDQKEKLTLLENEKTLQVSSLNLKIRNLNLEIDDLKQRVKDQEVSHTAKLQTMDFECSVHKNIIAELKKKELTQGTLQTTNFNLGVDLANVKREVITLKVQNQELRNSHQVKQDAAITLVTTQLKTSAGTISDLRASNSRLDVEQSKFKQEIMFLKAQNREVINQLASVQDKHKEVVGQNNREKQNNLALSSEVKDLSDLLTQNVKLTTLQQRGTFLEIKKSLQGMKNDLQFLIPHLNERTIPTSFECNKEMEKLNILLNRGQENLDKVIAYQGRFDHFVNSNRSLISMEKTPNFLSGIELPCSFLHIRFLPLFRITFSMMELPDNVPRPLMDPSQAPHNRSRSTDRQRNTRGTYNKNLQFSPRNNQNKEDNNFDPTQRNAYFRRGGRGGRGGLQQNNNNNNNKRKPRQNRNNCESKSNGGSGNDDSDAESSSGVILTVLTGGNATATTNTSAARKVVEKLDCVICCEPLRHPLMPMKALEYCMHKYHTSCIDEWFESNTECPQCAREDD